MPIKLQKFIKRSDLRDNPTTLYLFGDNDKRMGFGGQAKEMRGESNAVGIRTKKAPSLSEDSFYSDEDLYINMCKLDEDFVRVQDHLAEGGTIVLPINGIGTGRAQLARRAPETYQYLLKKIDELTKITGLGTA